MSDDARHAFSARGWNETAGSGAPRFRIADGISMDLVPIEETAPRPDPYAFIQDVGLFLKGASSRVFNRTSLGVCCGWL